MNTQYDLTRFDKVLADIKEIEEKGNFLPDCSNKEGYEASKRFVLDVTTPARKQLELVHKEVKAPFFETCKMLDQKKRELMPLLESIEAPHKEAYKAVDKAKKEEKERFERMLEDKVQFIRDFKNKVAGATSDQISALISECGEIDTEHDYYHRSLDAAKARNESLSFLEDALHNAIRAEAEAAEQARIAEEQRIEREKLEAEQAELARQRAEIEAQQAEIRKAQQEKQEAEERARQAEIEAERAAKEEAARIEHEKRIAALKAQQDADFKAEQERLEKERLEKEKAIRATRTKNRNTAAKALVDSLRIEKELAVNVINLIASGNVPFVRADF